MNLDQTCNLMPGTRDAIHVPLIVVQLAYGSKFKPGDWVRFTDETFTKIEACVKSEADGLINPFIDEIDFYDRVVVLLIPGITTPVHHHFEINRAQKELQKNTLEMELEEAKRDDPECAGSYAIKNGQVIRY